MANFKDIIGQEQIKEHLQMALSSGKISHAYIINGERFAGNSGSFRRTHHLIRCQYKFLTCLQFHLTAFKIAQTDFGSLGVQKGSYRKLQLLTYL